MQNLVLLLPRLLAGAAAVALGFWCASGAYEAGFDFAGPPAAIGFAALTVGCWFIPAIIRTTTLGTAIFGYAVLGLGTGLVIITAIGNGAKHRSATVGTAQNAIAAYTQAEAAHARLLGELATMRTNPKRPGEPHPRWTATAGCANATLPESEDYCKSVQRVRGEIAEARAILDKGRPLSADPQAASLRKFIDLNPTEINEWLPIIYAIGAELLATALMSLAFAPVKAPQSPVEAPQLTALAEPAWMSSSPAPGRAFPRYGRSTPFGRVDGRALRWLKEPGDPENPKYNDNAA